MPFTTFDGTEKEGTLKIRGVLVHCATWKRAELPLRESIDAIRRCTTLQDEDKMEQAEKKRSHSLDRNKGTKAKKPTLTRTASLRTSEKKTSRKLARQRLLHLTFNEFYLYK